MIRFFASICLIFAAMSAFIQESVAQEPITNIRLAINEYNIENNNFSSNLNGFVLNVFRSQGIQVASSAKPFLRAAQALDSGDVDGHVGTFATEWKGYIYPRWHYHVSDVSVLFRKDEVQTWKSYDSLAGKRIGWPKGYFYHGFFDKKTPIQLLELVDMKQCIRLLKADRLDFCMDGLRHVLQPAMKQMKLSMGEFQTETVFLEPVYIRFIDTPRSRQLIEIFDKRMDELFQSGKLENLYSEMGLPTISPDQSALAKRPRIVAEEIINGTDEWAKFVTYLNH
ncbi:MAG: transporter substrate-binding domain-containing protein [Magnetococcales bacterium]|nr:transporter substrate-binding domain-containing protein [Magnetococcales bacterium]